MSVEQCLVCLSDADFVAHGVVAPWIVKLCKIGSKTFSKLYNCPKCGFRWFDFRFNKTMMDSIYSDYRQGEYLRLRHKYEPWYSTKESSAFNSDHDQNGISNRKNFMYSVMEDSKINLSKIRSCLDFGGDLGQFIPREIHGSKYILDPSARSKESNSVIHISDLNELKNGVELIMNCHTIEHIPDFMKVIVQVNNSLENNGYLYLEVPQDSFKTRKFHASKTYFRYLNFCTNYPPLFILLDFLTGISRQLRGGVPALGIVKQSEHINYFNVSSIHMILTKTGFRVLTGTREDRTLTQGRLKLGRIGVVAQKTSDLN